MPTPSWLFEDEISDADLRIASRELQARWRARTVDRHVIVVLAGGVALVVFVGFAFLS